MQVMDTQLSESFSFFEKLLNLYVLWLTSKGNLSHPDL